MENVLHMHTQREWYLEHSRNYCLASTSLDLILGCCHFDPSRLAQVGGVLCGA